MQDRILSWPDCLNARDLGGLPMDGRLTRHGAIVRSDTPARLTAAGWAALHDYGIRTIISLRTHGMDEQEHRFEAPYPDIAILPVEIEDVTDREFAVRWASSELWGTPLYYADALQRWPARHAAALQAIAHAQPGGVLFHCVRGNDRTGIISLLLLSLAGVPHEHILADYLLSPDGEREAILAGQGTSTREVILGVLAGLDAEAYLRGGGASQDDLAAVRARLAG
jgi:hypothetical protein